MADEPDDDLLRRFVQGDRQAFEMLFRAFQGDVYRWSLRVVRDQRLAEDVVVDAFWRAYRGRARFDATRSFGAWMRRIATNSAKDHLRSATWRPAASAPVDVAVGATSSGSDADVREAVAIAFERLSPKLRVVATLALVEELPHAEIADALDVPVGTVKSRVFRAIRALRKELARLGMTP